MAFERRGRRVSLRPAGELAADHGGVVHVVHTQEEATAGDVAIDGESLDAARAVVRDRLDQLTYPGWPAATS
jgi:hypothetical protein